MLDAITANTALIVVQIALAVVMAGFLAIIPKNPSIRLWAIAGSVLAISTVIGMITVEPLRYVFLFLNSSGIILGMVYLWWGTQVFFEQSRNRWGWVISVGYAIVFGSALLLRSPMAVRIMLFSAGMTLLLLLNVHAIVLARWREMTFASWLTAAAYFVTAVGYIAQFVWSIATLGNGEESNETLPHIVVLYLIPLAGTLIAGVGLILLYFEKTIAEKDTLAYYDELTNLYNRRALIEAGRKELETIVDVKRPLSVLLIDIDHFKQINDRFGHEAGDYVLQRVAQSLQDSCRITDYVGRYGGEEFCVVCPNTNQEQASHLAERLLMTVRRLVLPYELTNHLSISIGVAVVTASTVEWDLLVASADRALYSAKSSGRDRFVLSQTGLELGR